MTVQNTLAQKWYSFIIVIQLLFLQIYSIYLPKLLWKYTVDSQ